MLLLGQQILPIECGTSKQHRLTAQQTAPQGKQKMPVANLKAQILQLANLQRKLSQSLGETHCDKIGILCFAITNAGQKKCS